MLTDDVFATRPAMHEAWMTVETAALFQRALFGVKPRWWGTPPEWRNATWNDLREIAERMIALGTELAERVGEAERVHLDELEGAWRRRARHVHAARLLGWPVTALVLADAVPCPDCGGRGGFGCGEGAEGCALCDMKGTIPRPQYDQLVARDTLWRPVRDAWLLEQFKTIQPITEL